MPRLGRTRITLCSQLWN
uniref:Alpha-mannosidase isoform X2 n=1 Tax=Rhizophora mucronata TaxID=61149 RepID=A0A2P2MM15_RHIMU